MLTFVGLLCGLSCSISCFALHVFLHLCQAATAEDARMMPVALAATATARYRRPHLARAVRIAYAARRAHERVGAQDGGEGFVHAGVDGRYHERPVRARRAAEITADASSGCAHTRQTRLSMTQRCTTKLDQYPIEQQLLWKPVYL